MRGRAPARREGYHKAILGSRDEEKGLEAAEGIEGNVYVRRLDVTDEKGIQSLACEIEEEFGRLDILVKMPGSP